MASTNGEPQGAIAERFRPALAEQAQEKRNQGGTAGISGNHQQPAKLIERYHSLARSARRQIRNYHDYLVIARHKAGITSLAEFNQLNPYLLDAMIEGAERARLDRLADEVTINNMLVKPVFMAQMDNAAEQKQQSSVEDFFDKENKRIERSHRDFATQSAEQEEVQASAFKSIFAERRKMNGNI